jgi:hypothetical protein
MLAPRKLRRHPLLAGKRFAAEHLMNVSNACRLSPLIGTVIAEEDNSIVAGLDYYLAAKRLGLAKVPVIRTAWLTARDKHRHECALAGEPAKLSSLKRPIRASRSSRS